MAGYDGKRVGLGPWSCLSLPEGPWTRWLCSGPHVPPLRRDPSLALLMTPPEGVSALSREGSKQAGSVVEVRAPQHFSDAPEERGGAYPHWGQARKVPRGWAGRAARWRPPPPPVAPVPPAPGSSGSDPLVTVAREGMEVVLSPEGPHAQLDLEPHRCSGHLSRSHRRVWTGAGAARLGG